MVEDIDSRKWELRQWVRSERAQVTDEDKAERFDGLTAQLSTLISARGAKFVSCYYPVMNEPNTLGFLAWAREAGTDVILPISREDGLLDWVRSTGEEVEPGLLGIPEPTGEPLSPLEVSDVDLMLIPACALDEQGNRIGWGRGYFDKTLGSMDRRPPVFAVVNDNEILETIPVDLHDVPVTGAVTPTRIIYFD